MIAQRPSAHHTAGMTQIMKMIAPPKAPPCATLIVTVHREQTMRRLTHSRIFLTIILGCLPPAARADDVCPPVTRIGLSDLGYGAFREGGKIGGISVDVANELARRTGCKIEIDWFPRTRLFVEMEAGRVDMTMGALRTPERDLYAQHLPYAYLQYDLVVQEPAGEHYASLSDFVKRGKGRLNVTRGMNYDPAVEAQLALLNAAGRLEVVNDFEIVFGKMDIGRADGTLATPPIYTRYLKSRRLKPRLSVIPMPESLPHLTGMYMSTRTMPADLRALYASALKAMVQEQVVVAIYAKYFDDATVRRIFRPGAAPLLSAMPAPEQAGLSGPAR
jgi:polar amino acid transport system substrate-binding protein